MNTPESISAGKPMAASNTIAPTPGIGPTKIMEYGLHGLVGALLMVSIIGIAYVYGFNLETGNLLDNISAAIRALGVDGGFFLGLYFSRQQWTREKHGWWDHIRAFLSGVPWFFVAMVMAFVSWLSNTLFVNGTTTIITQDLLTKSGITFINAKEANWLIGAIPLIIIMLYSIVPSRVQVHIDTRSTEEIEAEARREAARIRAQNMVAAARAEGAGQRIRTVLGGLATEAFNLEERGRRDERIKQMRIALETAGIASDHLSDEQIQIQVVARGLWDQAKDQPIKDERRQAVRTWALSQGLLMAAHISQESQMPPSAVEARYVQLAAQWREQEALAQMEDEEQAEATEAQPGTPAASIQTAPLAPPQKNPLARKAMLTVAEVNALTARPIRTINLWISQGKIKGVTEEKDEPDGKRRIPRKELMQIGWLTKDGKATSSNPQMPAIKPAAGNGNVNHAGNENGAKGNPPLATLVPMTGGGHSEPLQDGLAEDQQS